MQTEPGPLVIEDPPPELFVDGNLISWRSKKQTVVARSSAGTECRVMGHATCELLWFRSLLCELRVKVMLCPSTVITKLPHKSQTILPS